MAVAFPERQLEHALDANPLEDALGIVRARRAVPAVDAENEAEPVLAVLAEAWPADRAAELELIALQPRFLADLAAHAGDHVLGRIELAAQAVVFAKVRVSRPAVTMNQQHLSAI